MMRITSVLMTFLGVVSLSGVAVATSAVTVDTDAIMSAATLKPATEDGNGVAIRPHPEDPLSTEWDLMPNGILDSDEFAVIQWILADTSRPAHDGVHAAWTHNQAQILADMTAAGGIANLFKNSYGPALALYITLGDDTTLASLNALLEDGNLGFQLVKENYDVSQADVLSRTADPDNDGLTNAAEYALIPGTGGPASAKRTQYVAAAFSNAPIAYAIDFDTAMNTVATTVPNAAYLPATCDQNGPSGAANGILDSDEFAVFASILSNASSPYYWTLVRSFGANLAQMKIDLIPIMSKDNGALVSAYALIFAGYITLGDADSFTRAQALAQALGTDPKKPITVDLADYDQSLVNTYSAGADPDGDSLSNLEEYGAISGSGGPNSAKRTQYIREMFTISGCDYGAPTTGYIKVGQDVVLGVPGTGSGFEWFFEGTPLANGADYAGVHCQYLFIYNIRMDQAGVYTCTYNDGSKAITTYRTVVVVYEKVPAAGLAALGLSALLLGFMAVKRLRTTVR